MSLGDKMKIFKISLGEGAEAAAKKSQSLIEYSELSLEMASCKKNIDEIYLKIGEKVYNNYKDGDLHINNVKEILKYCEEIKEIEKEVKKIKKKILKLKDKKECKSCGKMIDKRAQFCDKCGCRQ